MWVISHFQKDGKYRKHGFPNWTCLWLPRTQGVDTSNLEDFTILRINWISYSGIAIFCDAHWFEEHDWALYSNHDLRGISLTSGGLLWGGFIGQFDGTISWDSHNILITSIKLTQWNLLATDFVWESTLRVHSAWSHASHSVRRLERSIISFGQEVLESHVNGLV